MQENLGVYDLIGRGRFGDAYFRAKEDFAIFDDPWSRRGLFDACVALCEKIYLPRRQYDKAHKCVEVMEGVVDGMHDPGRVRARKMYLIGEQCHPLARQLLGILSQAATHPVEAYLRFKELDVPVCLSQIAGQLISVCLANPVHFTTLKLNRELLDTYLGLRTLQPDLIHSLVLEHAIDLSRRISDFDFGEFLIRWGPGNFRKEDCPMSEGDNPFKTLIGQSARQLVDSQGFAHFSEFIAQSPLGSEQGVDLVSEALFRRLQQFGRHGRFEQLWEWLIAGVKALSGTGASHWHSALLEMGARLTEAAPPDSRFDEVAACWNLHDFQIDDYSMGGAAHNAAIALHKLLALRNEQGVKVQIMLLDNVLDHLELDDVAYGEMARLRAWASYWNGNLKEAVALLAVQAITKANDATIWDDTARMLLPTKPQLAHGMQLKAIILTQEEGQCATRTQEANRLVEAAENFMFRLIKPHVYICESVSGEMDNRTAILSGQSGNRIALKESDHAALKGASPGDKFHLRTVKDDQVLTLRLLTADENT